MIHQKWMLEKSTRWSEMERGYARQMKEDSASEMEMMQIGDSEVLHQGCREKVIRGREMLHY